MKPYRAKVAVMAAMARGRAEVDKKNFTRAIACFDDAARLDPRCAQAYLFRAGLKLLVSDEEGALEDFRALSGMDHSFLPAYRDLTTLSAEEFPALIAATESALRRDSRCAWAHVFHAFSLRSLMRYEEAIKDLDLAVACQPRCAALWAMRSRVKLTNRQGRYDGVRDMRKAVSLSPGWGWLHCWLGEALRHEGDFRGALRAFDRGLRIDRRYLRGFAWRGGTLVALGRFARAITDLDRSLAWDPIYSYDFEYTADQKSWAYNQKMLAHRGLGNVPEALRALNRAHAAGPRYAWVFNPKKEDAVYQAGVTELSDALRRRPRLAWAYAWRGWTFQQWERPREALTDLNRALRLSPRLAWAWAWKGKILLNLGQARDALVCLDRAVKLDRDYAPAWGWRAEARRLAGLPREAIADFTRAIALDHRAAWAFAGRGACRQKMGRLKQALEDLDRANAICPNYAQALAWRADARRSDGDLGGALSDVSAVRAVLAERLDSLGHLDVIEGIPVAGGVLVEILGAQSFRCFRALKRDDLSRLSSECESFGLHAASPEFLALKGRLHWLLGERLLARKSFEKALKADPKCAAALGYLGVLLMGDDAGPAIGFFDKAVAAKPNWAWPYLWRAAARIAKADFSAALADLDRFLKLERGKTSLAILLKSLAYLNLKKYRDSVNAAAVLIAADPGSCAGYGVRSAARLALGERKAAFEDYHQAKDREPYGGFNIVDQLISREGWSTEAEHLDFVERAIGEEPGVASFYVERAEILRGAAFSRRDLALADYARAQALEPGCAWIAAQMSRAEGPLLGLEKSLSRLDTAVSLRGSGWIYAWRGEALRLMGKNDLALKDFDAAIAKMPWYGYVYAWKGGMLASEERWTEALRCLDKAVDMETTYPTNALVYHARGTCKRALGDVFGAIEDVTRAFLLDEKYEWASTAAKPATQAQSLAAVKQLDAAIALDPRHSWALAWRGFTFLKLGRRRQAAADLSRALAADPSNARAYVWRARAYRESGKAAACVQDLKKALRLNPKTLSAAALLAEIYFSQGLTARAYDLLKGLGGDESANASFYALRGNLLLRLGRAQAAVADAFKAIALDKRCVQAHEALALASLELGDSQGALREADIALSLKPGLATALLARGLARGNMGDAAGRIEDFKKVYRIDRALFQGVGAEIAAALT